MKEAGASKQELPEAIAALCEGWGIERPMGGRGGGGGMMQQLTPEQREELKATVAEMKADGASKPEIREAVAGLFEGWGIERPRRGHGGGGGMMQQLTPEQRADVKAKIAEMKEDGTSKEDIHQAIRDLLEEWGIAPKPHE